MTRVTAPSRLHFGLLHVPTEGLTHWPDGTPVRHFGGLGLMIDRPGLELRVEPADEWSATGPLADRALAFARRFTQGSRELADRRFRIEVAHAPPEHVGLGVGTQLGMAVNKALAIEIGFRHLATADLAVASGRGERSGIGVHGFDRGGFLFDGGKMPGRALSALAARFDFPEEWRVIVAYPAAAGVHGEAERTAFARGRSAETALHLTEKLARLVATAILPALAERDYAAFGEALHEFNRLAGEPFVPDQGGPYSCPQVAMLIRALRTKAKLPAVGQSSWGPAVFAVTPDAVEALQMRDWLTDELPAEYRVIVCGGNNAGAVVT